MSEGCTADALNYITDLSGHYYRVNAENQLVIAGNKEEAGVFCAREVKERLRKGRKAGFYKVIPVEEVRMVNQLINEVREKEQPDEERYRELRNISQIDWLEYLQNFCYLASSMADYRQMLKEEQSETDLEITDILHYIELYEVRGDEYGKLIALLKDARKRRREINDEMFRSDCFQNALGSSLNVAKATGAIRQIERLDKRKYVPRKLQTLFDGACLQPDEKRTEIVKQEKESEAMEEKNQEEKMVCESRKKTVYDSRETDWLDFAGKQAEFFEQAEQYAYNLGCDLDEIEEAIEDVLVCIEDTNCNAAQGYEVFKKLKDLRNLKKKKERELYAVRVLMEPFNCADMLGAYRYCINALTQND